LAAQLPGQLKDPLSRRDFKVLSPLEEFYNSVAARAGLGFPDAVKLARIVMQTLEKATSSELLEKALAALPPGYEELLKSPITDPMSPTFDGLAKAGEQTPTMAQPGSEIDIFQILMAETRAIMGVMEKLRDTSTTQIQIREELLKEAEVRLMAKHKMHNRNKPYCFLKRALFFPKRDSVSWRKVRHGSWPTLRSNINEPAPMPDPKRVTSESLRLLRAGIESLRS
jgi:hypothetical protein